MNLDDPIVMAHSEGIASTRVGFSPFGSTNDGFSVDGDWIVRRTGDRDRAAGSRVGGGADGQAHAGQRGRGSGDGISRRHQHERDDRRAAGTSAVSST